MECCDKINCHEKGHICVPDSDLPRIVIVGGGFAGLNLIKELKNQLVQVVLIDRNNFHQFLPLLYQVATSGIEPDSIVFPFRKLFDDYNNVTYRMAEAISIDTTNNKLNTTIGSVNYDYLILANGVTTNYYGNAGFKAHGLGLNSLVDALDIRRKILYNLEQASVTCIKEEKEAHSSIVIVGGGPAGVEMAGALAEFKRYILPKDYPELKNIEMKIFLLEGANRLMQWMPNRLSGKTLKYLTDLKVIVKLNRTLKDYDGMKVTIDGEESFNAATLIWTAGVEGAIIKGLPDAVWNKQNRITVDVFNQVQTQKNVFVIGDLAHMSTPTFPQGYPMVAQSAIQQGKTLSKNLLRIIDGKPMVAFEYKDKGSMATIGKKKAVAIIKRLQFSGHFAWVIWSFVHLMGIIGARNKIMIATNWLWSYFTYDKGNRIIIRR